MSEAITVSRPKARRRGIIALQLLLVLGFLGIFAYAFQSTVLAPRSAIPDRVGELELLEKVEGDAAIAQVGRLHGTDITLEDAYIAKYGHSGLQLTAWVGMAADPAAAGELMRRMLEGIQRGGSGFSNLKRQTVSDTEVYLVDGPGGKHYFYINGEKVVWLIFEGGDYQTVLSLAVRAF